MVTDNKKKLFRVYVNQIVFLLNTIDFDFWAQKDYLLDLVEGY